MKVRLGLLVGIFLLWCLPSALLGQSVDTFSLDSSSVEMRFRIFYPVGKSELHKDYMDNANTLHRFQKYLEKSPQIDSITIYSYASPEGSYALNKRLMEMNANHYNYIKNKKYKKKNPYQIPLYVFEVEYDTPRVALLIDKLKASYPLVPPEPEEGEE